MPVELAAMLLWFLVMTHSTDNRLKYYISDQGLAKGNPTAAGCYH
jgi:hypothetical protein